MHTLLCVDDETDILDTIERLFRKKYRVLKASSGKEALKLLKDEHVSLIISDQRMPEMTGVEFLEKSIAIRPSAVRMLLTGFTDVESVISAINTGQIYRYITKPWDPRDLTAAVDRAIERYEMTEQLKEKNMALTKALEELKTLDTAKDQFMMLINHELKTPLTTLLSFLELLQETSLDAEQKKYADRMGTSAQRLREIIFDVLELVSAETGRMSVSRSKVSPQVLIDHAVGEFQVQADEKKQKIKIKTPDISVSADRKIIPQVLKRLLHNAIKFGDEKSTITITCSENEDQVVFSIQNTGRPISKEAIQRILKPFSLDENAMNHSKGLGLGLSLCQALLKTHGSQLQIESDGAETTVSFTL
jgi:two-component system sensor histidine kinase/response regulator